MHNNNWGEIPASNKAVLLCVSLSPLLFSAWERENADAKDETCFNIIYTSVYSSLRASIKKPTGTLWSCLYTHSLLVSLYTTAHMQMCTEICRGAFYCPLHFSNMFQLSLYSALLFYIVRCIVIDKSLYTNTDASCWPNILDTFQRV